MDAGFDITVSSHASVDDTLNLIIHATNEAKRSSFIKGVVSKFSPINDRTEFLRNVFNYYCRNVKYRLDPKRSERVYTPARTITEGYGDCKKAATFMAAVCEAAGITPILKHVYFDDDDDFTHIYVIVPNPDLNDYITLDPTNDCQFNQEVSYNTGTLYFLNGKKMELKYMGRPSSNSTNMEQDFSTSIGASVMSTTPFQNSLPHSALTSAFQIINSDVNQGKSYHSAIIDTLSPTQAIRNYVADIPLDKQRGAFLELVMRNVNGLAKMLVQVMAKNPNALTDMWTLVGGDIDTLKRAIIQGATNDGAKIGGFDDFLSGLAGAASMIIGVAAPIVNSIIPGAGLIAEGISAGLGALTNKPKPTPQQVATLPADPTGTLTNIPAPGHGATTSGSVSGTLVGFAIKSCLLTSCCHQLYGLTDMAQNVINSAIITSCVIAFIYKRCCR